MVILKIKTIMYYMNNNFNQTYDAINCKHEYINDYIDTMFPYREGILITYCQFCGLSKDYIQKLKKIENKTEFMVLNKNTIDGVNHLIKKSA